MRQVPHYSIIGDGRLARHLYHYLSNLGLSTASWSRRHDPKQLQLNDFIADAERLLLCISDDSLPSFISSYPQLRQKMTMHCSGCFYDEQIVGVHPLMTFATDLYAIDDYRAIPLIIDQAIDSDTWLPGLNNPIYTIDGDNKPLYHAMCVLGGNFSNILWNRVFTTLEHRLDLPADIMFPYMQKCVDNLQHNPDGALTGPLIRGDQTTIDRHLQALECDTLQTLYKAFMTVFSKQTQNHK